MCLINGGMTINMKHKFLNIFLAFAMLALPSAVLAEINTDGWELVASWDFTENANNGFIANNAVTCENGEGKLQWYHTITTVKKYKKAELDFDFRIEPFKDEERRVQVSFGLESNIGGSNFTYTDFAADGGKAHFVDSVNGDGFLSGGSDFLFKSDTDYNIRYIVSNDALELYAKTTDETDYTFVGERTGINIGEGKIRISCHDFGYIKNLKIYTVPELSVELAGGDNGLINTTDSIKLNFSKPIDEAKNKIKLTHDGEEVPFTAEIDGDVCKIVPNGGFLPQRQYNIIVESGLSSGAVVLEEDANFTVNTKPAVTIAEEFDDNITDDFTRSYATVGDDGRLKLENAGNIKTVKEFSEYVAEFDYLQEKTDGNGRITISPRAGVNNFVYIQLSDTDFVNIVDANGDGGVNSGLVFSGNVQYSFCVVVTKTEYTVYGAKTGDDYVRLNGNEISGTSGALSLGNLGSGYINNLYIYEYDDSVTTDPKDILARKGSTFDLQFASDMNDKTINTDNIKLSDETKDYSLNIERKSADTYKITLNEWLEYGKEYSLSLSEDVKSLFSTSPDADYAITLKTVDVPDAVSIENVKFNGDEYYDTALQGSCQVTAEAAYNLEEGTLNAVCACVVYDEDEIGSKMLMSEWQPINLSAADPLQNLTFNLKIPDANSPKIRIFVWDSLSFAGFLAEPVVRGE